MDSPTLHFHIDYINEKHGWIYCYLTTAGMTHRFSASGSMPPFHDLLDFLRSIALQRLPAWFFWDEEGYGPYFEAWPAGEIPDCDHPAVHLRVIHDTRDFHWMGEGDERHVLVNSYQVLWVDGIYQREDVVNGFLPALRDFVLYSQRPDDWGITLRDLEAFEHLRARRIPSRSKSIQTEPVDLILTRWQDDEEQTASQILDLRMWDMRLIRWRLDDSDAFWPKWLELLEHALHGRAYEMTVIDMFMLRFTRDGLADGSLQPSEVKQQDATRLLVTPLEPPGRARLQIFETDDRYQDFLRVDEIIDPVQLAEAFIKEFDKVLAADYQPYPDEDGGVFDLRELPLDRLKEKLSRK